MVDKQKGEPIPDFLRRGTVGVSGSTGGTVPGFESSIPVTRINIPAPPPPPPSSNTVKRKGPETDIEWIMDSVKSGLEHLERVWYGEAKACYDLENPEEGYKLIVDISLTRRAMVKSAEEQKPPTVKKPWYARAYLWWLGLDKD